MKVPKLVTEHPIPVDSMSYRRMLSLKMVYNVQFKEQLGRRDIVQQTFTNRALCAKGANMNETGSAEHASRTSCLCASRVPICVPDGYRAADPR